MKHFLLSIFIIIFLNSCGGTTRYVTAIDKCKNTITVIKRRTSIKDYLKTKISKSNGILTKKGNYFDIWFEEGFKNDTIQAYVNEKFLGKLTVSTDPSTGTTEKGFRYNYNKNESHFVLKIIKNGNECMEISLDKKYRQLFISYRNNKWVIIFDNIYPFYSFKILNHEILNHGKTLSLAYKHKTRKYKYFSNDKG